MVGFPNSRTSLRRTPGWVSRWAPPSPRPCTSRCRGSSKPCAKATVGVGGDQSRQTVRPSGGFGAQSGPGFELAWRVPGIRRFGEKEEAPSRQVGFWPQTWSKPPLFSGRKVKATPKLPTLIARNRQNEPSGLEPSLDLA